MKELFIGILFPLFFLTGGVNLKAQTADEVKYLMVLNSLHTSKDISKKIKEFFPKKINKRKAIVEFNYCDTVSFVGVSLFRKKLQDDGETLNEDVAISDSFLKVHVFEPYKSDFLSKLNTRNGSGLIVLFSKPFDNFLIISMGFFDPALFIRRKYGSVMEMLFKFDKDGFIEKIYYTGFVYN